MKLFISPWKSSTPRALSRYLGARLVRLEDARSGNVEAIVNWGCSALHGAWSSKVLNKPEQVRLAANKLRCIHTLGDNNIPTLDYTTDRQIALDWNKKSTIIAHDDLHGHSGRGLKKVEKDTENATFPFSSLYTRYFPKTRELRLLCIRDGAEYRTMLLEKKRVLPERYAEFGLDKKPDWWVRTYSNGWIFSREAEDLPAASELAIRACRAVGLDFAAVDILGKPTDIGWDLRVGEINTAPGLEGQTLDFFKTGLNRLLLKAA